MQDKYVRFLLDKRIFLDSKPVSLIGFCCKQTCGNTLYLTVLRKSDADVVTAILP